MKKLWNAWVELTSREEPATALALVRISAAFVLICDHLWIWHVGLIDPLWSIFPAGFATGYRGWSHDLGIDAHGLWAIAIVLLVLAAIGLFARPACLLFAIVSAQQASIAPDSESAIDMLMRIVFIILALSRCNAKWSVDAWIRKRIGRPMPALVPAWPRYLLMMQLCWIYFSGGQNKSGASWGPHGGFTALGNALLDPHNGRLPAELISAVYPLTRVATALTMAFELCGLAYLLFYYYAATPDRPGRLRRFCNRLHLRWIWIGLGIAFEIGIAVGLRLGAFPFGMLALFWVLLRPDELQRGLQMRLKTRVPAKRASSPS